MKSEIVAKVLGDYFNDMLGTVLEMHGLKDDGRDWLKDKCFTEAVKEDLLDKDFNDEEIRQVIAQDMTKDTAYHICSYIFSLANGYETLDELKKSISEDFEIALEEFSDEDLKKIYTCRLFDILWELPPNESYSVKDFPQKGITSVFHKDGEYNPSVDEKESNMVYIDFCLNGKEKSFASTYDIHLLDIDLDDLGSYDLIDEMRSLKEVIKDELKRDGRDDR